MSAVPAATAGRPRALSIAPLLLRARRDGRDGRRVLSALAIAAYAVTQFLLLAVVGGLLMFLHRNAHPAAQWEREASYVYVMLAIFAVVLLAAPLLSLGAAAARLGASRRERRLASLRLLGATPADVTLWTLLEVLRQAAFGVLVGSVAFAVALPAWHLLAFQGRAIGYLELVPSWWSWLAVSVGVLLMALLSALTGLSRVRITPLGVARRASTPRVHVARLGFGLVVLTAWVIGGSFIGRLGTAIGSAVAFAFLALILAAVNAAGPYLVRLLGLIMAKTARGPAGLLAGRRLVQDPHAGWRAVAALALASFVAGCTVMLPALAQNAQEPEQRIFAQDCVTGALLTLAIAFVITAVSTGIAQAAAVLERADDARSLALTGAPLALQRDARRHEVLLPVVLAVVPSVGAALLFQLPLLGRGIVQAASGVALLLGALAIGIGLVVLAEEACNPLQRSVVAERTRKAD